MKTGDTLYSAMHIVRIRKAVGLTQGDGRKLEGETVLVFTVPATVDRADHLADYAVKRLMETQGDAYTFTVSPGGNYVTEAGIDALLLSKGLV